METLETIQILALDDNTLLLTFYSQIAELLNSKARCDTAENIAEFKSLIAKNKYDIFILDIHLGINQNAFDLIPDIKANNPLALYIYITGLNDIKLAVQAIKTGGFDYLTKPFKTDELLKILNKAVQHYKLRKSEKYYKDTINEIKTELKYASDIQSALSKRNINFKEIDIETFQKQTKYIGGDFYDTIRIDNNRIGIVLGDVAGHGITASMIAVMVMTLIRRECRFSKSPAKTIRSINKIIYRNLRIKINISIFFGIYNRITGSFRYTNAGCEYPILIKNKSQNIYFLRTGTTFIGIFKDILPAEESVSLHKEDKIIIYSDGLLNTRKKDKSFLLFSEFCNIINNNRKETNKNLIKNIIKTIKKISNKKEQEDDITLIALEVNKNSENNLFHLTYPPYIEYLQDIRIKLLDIKKEFNLSDYNAFRLRFVIEELFENSVNNAYREKFKKIKFIEIMITLKEKLISIYMQDHGKGFQYQNFLNTLNDNQLYCERGRGIFLVKEISDKFILTSGKKRGTEISIILKTEHNYVI